MNKGRESLAFVKDRQVVLLVKQILEFLLCSGQALIVASPVSKSLGPCFQDVYYRVVGYSYRLQPDVFVWTGIGAQRVLVPPGPGPGCQILFSLGVESPSLISSAQTSLAHSLLWRPGKSLTCPFQRGEERL